MVIKRSKKFDADIDYYIRKKKYKKILDDIESVLPDLEAGNLVGVKLEDIKIPEGTAVYKVRIANSSANVGKSNGFRLIYYLAIGDEIYLLTIYSKKDDERIPNDEQIALIVSNTLEF